MSRYASTHLDIFISSYYHKIMNQIRKIFLFIVLPLIIILAAILFFVSKGDLSKSNSSTSVPTTASPSPSEDLAKVSFTSKIFDPAQISHITPLGELNGGYSEWQAVTGVMINIKPEVVAGDKMINVYAPAAMTLDSYSYHYDPRSPGDADWALIFRINKDVTLKFNHITKAVERIVAVTTSTPKDRSNEESPKSKISFEAGELIATTHGTSLAKNWNIYMTDRSVMNNFANQTRYEKSSIGNRFINGACPFDYYESAIKATYLALMGATKAGQSQNCGNPSKDVAGTLSGAWFFDEDSSKTEEQIDGNFVSPLAVYRDSAGRVIIDQIANTQFRIEGGTDPATVKSEHCYKLVSNNNQPAGYAYFKLIGLREMQLAYGASGSCPTVMPSSGAKTYFR